MLSDREITQLRADKNYKKLIKSGVKKIGSDFVKSSDGEFRTDLTFWLKFSHSFLRARMINQELFSVADTLLCNLLNHELNWSRDIYSIENICDCINQGYVWMRYDVPRVGALFLICEKLLMNAEYRNLIKNYSTINGNKNERLRQLLEELEKLHFETIFSIKSFGILSDIVEIQKTEYYKNNKDIIKDKILSSLHNGYLGIIPENNAGDKHE